MMFNPFGWRRLPSIPSTSSPPLSVHPHLKVRGLKEGYIFKTWMEHCVLLLKAQSSPMYMYTGPEDLTWVSRDELGLEEVERHLSFLTGPQVIKDSRVAAMEAFSAPLPPSDISIGLL